MDNTKLKIKKYQKVLSQYLTNLAKEGNNSVDTDVKYQAIIDTQNNHFQLVVLGWDNDTFIYSVLIHLDINPLTGNIWIQQNNTEIDLDIELEKIANVPKKHFVLGFRPDYVREHSDYAVA